MNDVVVLHVVNRSIWWSPLFNITFNLEPEARSTMLFQHLDISIIIQRAKRIRKNILAALYTLLPMDYRGIRAFYVWQSSTNDLPFLITFRQVNNIWHYFHFNGKELSQLWEKVFKSAPEVSCPLTDLVSLSSKTWFSKARADGSGRPASKHTRLAWPLLEACITLQIVTNTYSQGVSLWSVTFV